MDDTDPVKTWNFVCDILPNRIRFFPMDIIDFYTYLQHFLFFWCCFPAFCLGSLVHFISFGIRRHDFLALYLKKIMFDGRCWGCWAPENILRKLFNRDNVDFWIDFDFRPFISFFISVIVLLRAYETIGYDLFFLVMYVCRITYRQA